MQCLWMIQEGYIKAMDLKEITRRDDEVYHSYMKIDIGLTPF